MAKPNWAEDVPPVGSESRADPYTLRTADEIAARPHSKYWIKGLLPETGVACVFGASQSGKSFLAMDMCLAVAESTPWFAKRVRPADIVWICQEGVGGLEKRVKALKQHHGQHVASRMRFLVEPFNLTNMVDVDRLIEAVQQTEMQGGIIVLDTLNASTPGMNENDSAEMGVAIANCKTIQAACGGLVILIHHSGKDAAKGLRGHSSLHGALDTLIEVTRKDDRREWQLIKSKDGADGESHPFRLEIIEVGIDEDGDAITSCVISLVDPQAAGVQNAKLPRGGNQRIAYDCIGPLLQQSNNFGMEGAPGGRPCIQLETAVSQIRELLTCASDQKTRSAKAAIDGLVTLGCLKHKNGWIWLT